MVLNTSILFEYICTDEWNIVLAFTYPEFLYSFSVQKETEEKLKKRKEKYNVGTFFMPSNHIRVVPWPFYKYHIMFYFSPFKKVGGRWQRKILPVNYNNFFNFICFLIFLVWSMIHLILTNIFTVRVVRWYVMRFSCICQNMH